MPDGSPTVRLAEVRQTPLDVAEVLAAVQDMAAGGTCVFVGTVRDLDGGRAVRGLGYQAHPDAEPALRRVGERVASAVPVVALAAVHREGELDLGDAAVVVAASAAHREEAFRACRDYIDTLKREVPIWKHQRFVDGDEEWVGVPGPTST